MNEQFSFSIITDPHPMHIPDGFLSVAVALFFWLVSITLVGLALRRAGRELGERQAPLMGVLAACIFAAQMLNFPVAAGTSGHLVGAALAAILLGPWTGTLVLTAVVTLQATLFQDGGLLALGANIFNMAIVGVWVAYAVYQTVQRLAGQRPWGIFLGGAIAAWLSIVIAALSCSLQLALSGTSPAQLVIPAMGGVHMLIGIGEALITVGALALVWTARRDLLSLEGLQPTGRGVVYVGGLAIALLLAILSPLASTYPDGLEWVAEQQGFLEMVQEPPFQIIPDYVFPGIPDQALATIAAGVVGTVLVFGVSLATAWIRAPRRTHGGT